MEKQNPTDPPFMERLPGTGDESHPPQPRGIGEPPPQTEEGKEGHSAGRALTWEEQWLQFLARVQRVSQETLGEEALWDQAQVLLAALGPKPEVYRKPLHVWALRPEAELTLAFLPQEWQAWLREHGLQRRSQVVALVEAFLWRRHESWRRENQEYCNEILETLNSCLLKCQRR